MLVLETVEKTGNQILDGFKSILKTWQSFLVTYVSNLDWQNWDHIVVSV